MLTSVGREGAQKRGCNTVAAPPRTYVHGVDVPASRTDGRSLERADDPGVVLGDVHVRAESVVLIFESRRIRYLGRELFPEFLQRGCVSLGRAADVHATRIPVSR